MENETNHLVNHAQPIGKGDLTLNFDLNSLYKICVG